MSTDNKLPSYNDIDNFTKVVSKSFKHKDDNVTLTFMTKKFDVETFDVVCTINTEKYKINRVFFRKQIVKQNDGDKMIKQSFEALNDYFEIMIDAIYEVYVSLIQISDNINSYNQSMKNFGITIPNDLMMDICPAGEDTMAGCIGTMLIFNKIDKLLNEVDNDPAVKDMDETTLKFSKKALIKKFKHTVAEKVIDNVMLMEIAIGNNVKYDYNANKSSNQVEKRIEKCMNIYLFAQAMNPILSEKYVDPHDFYFAVCDLDHYFHTKESRFFHGNELCAWRDVPNTLSEAIKLMTAKIIGEY